MLAMGIATVASAGGRPADLALGGSSPTVTRGWHGVADRPTLARFRSTIAIVRALLAGERGPGGFRLRVPADGVRIVVAAFGPKLLALAGELADVVVLSLVTTEELKRAAAVVEESAAAAGQPRPRVAVWVPAAVDEAGAAQVARGISLYAAQPGYGEMFTAAGFGSLVEAARGGRHPRDLEVPPELAAAVGAIGSVADVQARLAAYGAAGADVVCLVPATAVDPGAARLLATVSAVGATEAVEGDGGGVTHVQ
jgi:alkanesulfonate monooxygenase SsuD/methylene tetrahydromethanopterin reductase-like flavin-dependent oxidoreductase (luciferase family)